MPKSRKLQVDDYGDYGPQDSAILKGSAAERMCIPYPSKGSCSERTKRRYSEDRANLSKQVILNSGANSWAPAGSSIQSLHCCTVQYVYYQN